MSKKPAPKPVDPSDLPRLARAVIEADRFPFLATVDGDQPRLRPVSPVRTDGFTVCVANLKSYHKTKEIDANPRVELAYLSGDHDQVRISGRAEVVRDAALLQEIWSANPLLRHYLGSLDNPELVIYRIVPEQVRFMREWSLEYQDVPFDTPGQDGSSSAPTRPRVDHRSGAHDRGSQTSRRRRSGSGPRSGIP
jgi:general stress protein 26